MKVPLSCCSLIGLLMPLSLGGGELMEASKWLHKPILELEIDTRYDSNPYLQDPQQPEPVPDLSREATAVMSLKPTVGFLLKQDIADVKGMFKLRYSPEFCWFLAEAAEDYRRHRIYLNTEGSIGSWSFRGDAYLAWTEGGDTAPSFNRKGGAPALGAPEIRDRQDNLYEKQTFQFRRDLDLFFVRAVHSAKFADFKTENRPLALHPGYQNYCDRDDIHGGIDAGVKWMGVDYYIGYRYGKQDHELVDYSESWVNSSNAYQRVLGGIAGSPWPWLKLDLCMGVDFRRFTEAIQVGVPREVDFFYTDSKLSFLPTRDDTLQFETARYFSPSSSGRGGYETALYLSRYTHTFSGRLGAWDASKLKGGLEFKIDEYDSLWPLDRRDLVYTYRNQWDYQFTNHYSATIYAEHQSAQSDVIGTDGREYERNLAGVTMKYSF